MAESTIERSLAKPVELRIGNTIIDLYPIRIKDWPEASKLMYLLNFESLADIAYVGGLQTLDTLVRVVARAGELASTEHFEAIQDMVNEDFQRFRQTVRQQNDIDMDRLNERLAKITGNQKNAETPPSQ